MNDSFAGRFLRRLQVARVQAARHMCRDEKAVLALRSERGPREDFKCTHDGKKADLH